ncbi:T9SS type A sorting domain-containing protein [candidate division KSB1 bacterium]|nr:T9SS type A sorting domain-containing protein [candidate division KSB1 bacterium]
MKHDHFIIIFSTILVFLHITNSKCNSQENYFPLQTGNTWYFQTVPVDTNLSITWNISDTTKINHKTYYIFNGVPVRKDSSGSIWEHREGQDILWLNFNTTHDTNYTYISPWDTFNVEIRKNLTITTPIQKFENCIQFYFDIPEVADAAYNYYFAPNIGPVFYSNSMNPYELYAATINGENYTKINSKNNPPVLFQLEQNYPNPFNNATRINFSVNKPARVKIKIFNINGQYINTIMDKFLTANNYSITWAPLTLASGKYIINLFSDNFEQNIVCSYIK